MGTTPENSQMETLRVGIKKAIQGHGMSLKYDKKQQEYVVAMGKDEREEIMTHMEVLDHIENDTKDEVVWSSQDIMEHQGPLSPNHSGYAGSSYNVQPRWDTGEVTYERLDLISKNDPITSVKYAEENDLLDKPE